jgi:hypothetical protein
MFVPAYKRRLLSLVSWHEGSPKKSFGPALAVCAALLSVASPGAAVANNVGESIAWQFETTADKLNRAAIEDLRLKRLSGYYAAPIYNTYIDRQYNCSVTSTATGNDSVKSAVGNSPSSGGNSASSLGNNDSTSMSPGFGSQDSSVTGNQTNEGEVESSARGNVSTSVRGDTFQTLNTAQDNSGNQSANVSASNACQFGALNQ